MDIQGIAFELNQTAEANIPKEVWRNRRLSPYWSCVRKKKKWNSLTKDLSHVSYFKTLIYVPSFSRHASSQHHLLKLLPMLQGLHLVTFSQWLSYFLTGYYSCVLNPYILLLVFLWHSLYSALGYYIVFISYPFCAFGLVITKLYTY